MMGAGPYPIAPTPRPKFGTRITVMFIIAGEIVTVASTMLLAACPAFDGTTRPIRRRKNYCRQQDLFN